MRWTFHVDVLVGNLNLYFQYLQILVTLYVWRWSIDCSWTLDSWSCSYQVWSKKHLIISDHWLVVWNMAGLWLSIYWECHHPNWRTPSFFRGVGIPPTGSYLIICIHLSVWSTIRKFRGCSQESLGHLPTVGPFGAQPVLPRLFFCLGGRQSCDHKPDHWMLVGASWDDALIHWCTWL